MSNIFVLNCGSSSIKFQLVDPSTGFVSLKGLAENLNTPRCRIVYSKNDHKQSQELPDSTYQAILASILTLLDSEDVTAIGHRVVHGGEAFQHSVQIDANVLDNIKACNHLAPLHNPVNALGIEITQQHFPELPQVAVFDTAFHQTMPKHAYLYALPYTYYETYQVRRYGFHGTSHRYVISEAAKQLGKPLQDTAFISAHLGNGCSVCAAKGGASIDTSMGFTPLEGLMMGQRSGDIDPTLVLFLAKQLNVPAEEVITLFNTRSGLLGVSGISEDMRLLMQQHTAPRAQLAIEMFCYRLAKYIASYIVPLKCVDALIFTGGIGENAVAIREQVLEHLTPFNLDALVIPTNEELLIAQDTMDIIGRAS